MEKRINRTRKERIVESKKLANRARNQKLAGVTLATAITTTAFFSSGVMNAKANSGFYTVQSGDTLTKIAKQYHTTVELLKSENKLASETIFVGQRLEVPTHYSIASLPTKQKTSKSKKSNKYVVVKQGDTLFQISKAHKVKIQDLKLNNRLKTDIIYVGQKLSVKKASALSTEVREETAIYTVVPGDTLWGISKRFDIPVDKIKLMNGMKSDMVLIDQKLMLKDKMRISKAKVIGAADKFTVEFNTEKGLLTLKVAYGTAETYQKLSGKEVFIFYKNGALINLQ
ncbi:LysM peptidoglycan-binding domain-containing protein [Bacillus sp. 31A1R]|uniref:LysM peptidoglycan-binding domain-containing protein n=1 Tax=Robertmurraya mangrovi TaxID=3098077 RepID=A0ABU5IXF9_9BACI|nr:LysM peptidoglycan-binding domain-containing protein [Bacillus sp. 31A1R]MDZ5471842.1 LysM peptidoglycan-binding domain-containing protein [Bacillus sp. 31A1R]